MITEIEGENGRIERAVDFDALRDLLEDVAEGNRERYQFTWPVKQRQRPKLVDPLARRCVQYSRKAWAGTPLKTFILKVITSTH